MISRNSLGRIVAGLLLVALGVLWMFEEFTEVDLPWTALLAAALVVIGAALMFGASGGSHPSLVVLGVVLSVLVVGSSALGDITDVPFRGGVGDRNFAPATPADEYRLAVGSLTVDLTESALDGQEVTMSVGIGELVVIVPRGTAVTISAAAGIGEVVALDQTESGFGPEVVLTATGEPAVVLNLRVGIGKVEVREG